MKNIPIRLYRAHDSDLIYVYKNQAVHFKNLLKIVLRNYAQGKIIPIYIPDLGVAPKSVSGFKAAYKIILSLDETKDKDILYLIDNIKPRFRCSCIKSILRKTLISYNLSMFFQNDTFQNIEPEHVDKHSFDVSILKKSYQKLYRNNRKPISESTEKNFPVSQPASQKNKEMQKEDSLENSQAVIDEISTSIIQIEDIIHPSPELTNFENYEFSDESEIPVLSVMQNLKEKKAQPQEEDVSSNSSIKSISQISKVESEQTNVFVTSASESENILDIEDDDDDELLSSLMSAVKF